MFTKNKWLGYAIVAGLGLAVLWAIYIFTDIPENLVKSGNLSNALVIVLLIAVALLLMNRQPAQVPDPGDVLMRACAESPWLKHRSWSYE